MISYSLNEAGPLFTVLKNCNTINTTDRADKLSNTGEKLDCIIIRSFELYRPDVIYEWVIHVLGFSKYKKKQKTKTPSTCFLSAPCCYISLHFLRLHSVRVYKASLSRNSSI